ncbi:MAG TPA: hypothetical protein VFV38_22940 [Ktedonobacteraceae bacterium]|nr:hypothetical protein [Ktedonobacteraceae bacterium]
MQEIILPWEQTSNGLQARLKVNHPFSKKNLFPVKVTAERKMDSIAILSARFSDDIAVFEPHVSLLLDKGSSMEFFGWYRSGFEHEEEREEAQWLPSFCLRYASWEKGRDFQHFHQATNKHAYIQGSQQVEAKSIFCSWEMYPELQRLLKDVVSLVQQGIPFQSVSRPEHPWASVDLLVRDTIGLKCSYVPSVHANAVLEEWIEQWEICFAQVNLAEGIKPEGDFRISYFLSLKEYIERFPEA